MRDERWEERVDPLTEAAAREYVCVCVRARARVCVVLFQFCLRSRGLNRRNIVPVDKGTCLQKGWCANVVLAGAGVADGCGVDGGGEVCDRRRRGAHCGNARHRRKSFGRRRKAGINPRFTSVPE